MKWNGFYFPSKTSLTKFRAMKTKTTSKLRKMSFERSQDWNWRIEGGKTISISFSDAKDGTKWDFFDAESSESSAGIVCRKISTTHIWYMRKVDLQDVEANVEMMKRKRKMLESYSHIKCNLYRFDSFFNLAWQSMIWILKIFNPSLSFRASTKLRKAALDWIRWRHSYVTGFHNFQHNLDTSVYEQQPASTR